MDKLPAKLASWCDASIDVLPTAETEDFSGPPRHCANAALAAARGEAKGLLIASQMAERAWAAVWDELRTQRAERVDLEHGLQLLEVSLANTKAAAAETGRQLEDTEARLATAEARQRDVQAELWAAQADLQDAREQARAVAARLAEAQARLADTLESYSWRITAPVRWLRNHIYRRS